MMRALAFLALLVAGIAGDGGVALAQRQLPDLEFTYANDAPAYAPGAGPQILFSTKNSEYVERGSLDPLGALAKGDGFKVSRVEGSLTGALGDPAGILVVANPFLKTYRQFPAMTPPSAFDPDEIEAVRAWVEAGGSLLILADHAPFGGGSSDLAKAFGFEFLNGHTAQTQAADVGDRRVNITFTPDNGLSATHPITDGSTGRKKITRYQAYGGQSFIPPGDAVPLLTIPQGWSAIFTYRLEAEIGTRHAHRRQRHVARRDARLRQGPCRRVRRGRRLQRAGDRRRNEVWLQHARGQRQSGVHPGDAALAGAFPIQRRNRAANFQPAIR